MVDTPNAAFKGRQRIRRATLLIGCCVVAVAVTAAFLLRSRPREPPAPAAALAPREARIVVHVVSTDGRPVAGAHVGVLALELSGPLPAEESVPDHFVPRGGERLQVNVLDVKQSHTDADGTAEVIVREPLLDVLVYAARGVNVAMDGPIRVRRSETVRVDLRLTEGLVAAGTVTDSAGRPRADVRLHISWIGVNLLDVTQNARRAVGTSEADGSFRLGPITPLPAGAEVELLAFADGLPTPVRVVLPAWRGESDALTITVPSKPR